VRVGAVLLILFAPGLTPAFAQTSDDDSWSVSAAAFVYAVPDEANYAQPTAAADRGWIHVEARYNYEERNTGSLWGGFNLGGDGVVEWTLTPMAGGVFGDVTGIAPGYNGSLAWRRLNFFSEGEWVFDTTELSESFFYNWSELAFAPAEWVRLGIVTQRTRAYQTDRDIQRGVLLGFTYRDLEAAMYVFNPDGTSPVVVVSMGWSFTVE
jgi:hypothetical protein